jgi:hypothetical protein
MRQALTGLAGDGEAVARLLRSAIEGFAAQREIGAVLRKAAATCTQSATQTVDDGLAGVVLAEIAASYTMARERTVHARFAPPPAGRLVDAPVQTMAGANRADAELADAALADMLF